MTAYSNVGPAGLEIGVEMVSRFAMGEVWVILEIFPAHFVVCYLLSTNDYILLGVLGDCFSVPLM